MILRIHRDNAAIEWNDEQQKFEGNADLSDYVQQLVRFNSRMGSDAYGAVVQDAQLWRFVVDEYVPDEYPEGTLDV